MGYLVAILLFLPLAIPLGAQNSLRVTGSWKNVSIKHFLDNVEKLGGVTFAYRPSEIDLKAKVSAEASDEDIVSLVERVLSPWQIVVKREGKMIVLHKGASPSNRVSQSPDKKSSTPPGQRTIKGVVVAATDRSPLPGATVYVPGTGIGTVADINGNYSITVTEDVKEIVFSMLGYLDKAVKTSENDNYFRMVFLDESAKNIDEAVVVAFGTTQKKESIVTSIETITPDKLKNLHSPTLSQAFAGQLAGVIATQSSGEPGADGASFWIRGISTFGGNKTPLYILDGVEVGIGILDGISPESIESFAVLKDAAATALYGSRGANGVMIITTKTGRVSDKMSVNIHFNSTVNTFTKVAKIADGVTYMRDYNEALVMRGLDPLYTEERIAATAAGTDPYVYPNVNWYDLLFKKMSFSQNVDINIRGGGNRVDYFLSAMFSNQDGMIKNSPEVDFDTGLNAKKFSFQSNVTARVTNSTTATVKMTSILFYKHMPYADSQRYFAGALYANPVTAAPTYPTSWIKDADYVIFGGTNEWDSTISWTNPYKDLSTGYREAFTSNSTISLRLDQNFDFITPGLKLWGQASFYIYTSATTAFSKTPWLYRLTSVETDPFTGEKDYVLSLLGNEGSKFMSSSTSSSGYREYNLQANLEYKRTFGNHFVNAVVLYHQKEHMDNQASTYYNRLPRREQGFAGRLSYIYGDRYVLEGNFGYNGSENFMRGHRWGFFPSVAAGWIVSNEPFWTSLKPVVNMLKLRYSYGLSGNDYLSQRFPYISSVTMGSQVPFLPGSGINGFQATYGNSIAREGNEEATWEVSRKHDLGLELGLWNRFKMILDLFDEHRTGIFQSRHTLPATAGLSRATPVGNLGAVRNRGVDLSLEYSQIINKDFSISFRGTFTYAHNEITAYDEPAVQIYPYQSVIGVPVNKPFVLEAVGLFKDQDDIDNSPIQTFISDYRPGDIKYKDQNGDNKIDKGDFVYLGAPTVPEINYGFGATTRFKDFDFSFFFAGRAGVSIELSDAVHPFVNQSNRGFNIFKWVSDGHWREDNPNPDAVFPRLDWDINLNNVQKSTYWLRDGSFLRLKNVEVGYNWKDKLRVYCTGTNLFIISPFKYWDPELKNGAGVSYPLTRTAQVGFQLFF